MVSPFSNGVPALLLAGSILAVFGWTTETKTVEAQPTHGFDDADGDFLPDAIEWVLMTDPQVPDTDEDGVGDFIEVVQNGFPLNHGDPTPQDHEMRVLATTRVDDAGVSQFWLHLLFRSMAGLEAQLEGFVPWVDVGGVQYPIHGLFVGKRLESRVLHHDDEGTLVLISLPLATERAARTLLPFSVGASATLGGRPVTTAAYFMDVEGTTANLTALDDERSALQSLRQEQHEEPFAGTTNRLCVLKFDVVGASRGSKIVRVRSAECEPAHGLRCAISCPEAVGRIFFLPDGMSTITGG